MNLKTTVKKKKDTTHQIRGKKVHEPTLIIQKGKGKGSVPTYERLPSKRYKNNRNEEKSLFR